MLVRPLQTIHRTSGRSATDGAETMLYFLKTDSGRQLYPLPPYAEARVYSAV